MWDRDHIWRPKVFTCLEHGDWPDVGWMVRQIDALTKEEVLANAEFLEVAGETGGFGHPSYPTERQVEFDWFKRKLIAEDIPALLESLTLESAGVEKIWDHDLLVSWRYVSDTERRFFYQDRQQPKHHFGPYWPARRLCALGILGRLTELHDWMDLLPLEAQKSARFLISNRAIDAVDRNEQAKLEAEVRHWRSLAVFYSTPEQRDSLGLAVDELISLEQAFELHEYDWRTIERYLGLGQIAVALQGVEEAAVEQLLTGKFWQSTQPKLRKLIQEQADQEEHAVSEAQIRLRAIADSVAESCRIR